MKSVPQDLDSADWTGYEIADRRYQVTHRMGQGGMATVYHACDRRLRTEVVIKVPLARMLAVPEFAARFSREIRSMTEFSHPHIVHVLDVGSHEDLPFAVLQYLSGGSLEDRLRPEAAFAGASTEDDAGWQAAEPASLVHWLSKIAAALDYIHTKGVVHRDVKPGNILFDEDDNPYLTDFGIVKALGEMAAEQEQQQLTSFGSVLGTIRFMAPEVLAGLRYDGRADQFALAVTAYLALTGRYPFQGNSPVTMLYQQSLGRPRPIHELRRQLSAESSAVLSKALDREPQGRFATCSEFSAALLRALEPQAAAPAKAVADAPAGSLSARLPVNTPVRRLRHELRLMLLARGAAIDHENDVELSATLPLRPSWLERWLGTPRPVRVAATWLCDENDAKKAVELALHIAAAGRNLTANEHADGRGLCEEARELLLRDDPKSTEDSVSALGGSTVSRAADMVDVNIVGQDLGFVCRVAKAAPQGVWLIAGSTIPQGLVDISFGPNLPKERGRIVRTIKRNDGTFAIGVAFAEPVKIPTRLLKLLEPQRAND